MTMNTKTGSGANIFESNKHMVISYLDKDVLGRFENPKTNMKI